MDPVPFPAAPARLARKPRRTPRVALVMQGGGALGAYQAGVYQALHEAGLEPDWIVGISIGAIGGAILAGSPPEQRVARLTEFWDEVTSRPVLPPFLQPERKATIGQRLFNAWSAWEATALGQPGFFTPRFPGPWLSGWLTQSGTPAAVSFYDDAPLRATLRRLVDFERINRGALRFSLGATNVANGQSAYFDSALQRVGLDHVMAASALPPALPMVTIEGETYWDGGVVSNTPLQYLLDQAGAEELLVFQIDLFSPSGPVPQDMIDVLGRQKDILYASRTQVVLDTYTRMFRDKIALRTALGKLDDDKLDAAERRLKKELERLPDVSIVHLTCREPAAEDYAKDYEFSAEARRRHWASGHRDAAAALAHQDWLRLPEPGAGIVIHAPS